MSGYILNKYRSDTAPDNGWKDKLKIPIKDARPQTEVRFALFIR